MALTRRAVDLRAPPEELDDLIDWFDAVCINLVLLEDYSPHDLGAAIQKIDGAVRAHLSSSRGMGSPDDRASPPSRRTLAEDHLRFLVSLEQLHWCYRVVERENHGGHRQALGQYGQVFMEALRRHCRDERSYAPEKP